MMDSLQLPEEILNSLQKLLKSHIIYVTVCSWVSLPSSKSHSSSDSLPKLNKSHIVLCQESLNILDERFDKVFATIKYANISKILIDINHQQCFQIIFNYQQNSPDLTALLQQIQRNPVLKLGSIETSPFIFLDARLDFINHLQMSWKTDYMIKNFDVKNLEVYNYDLMKLRVVKDTTGKIAGQSDRRYSYSDNPKIVRSFFMSQTNTFNQLSDQIPPASDRVAVGGDDLWYLNYHKSYLIDNIVFQIDSSFVRSGLNDFHHEKSKNLRIHIEVSRAMPLSYLKQIGARQYLQVYAEYIFKKTILQDLDENGEVSEYTILVNQSYNKRHNLNVKRKLSKTEGWVLQVRTVYRDIFLIIIRESYLPPACAFFQDYYMIIYGDPKGEYDDIQLQSGIVKSHQLYSIITSIIDNARYSHYMEQAYQDALIQQSLDSLLFQTFEDYNYLSTNCKFISQYIVFGIPFIISVLQNMKYRSTKDEKIIEEIQRQQYQPTLKELLSKYKELIEQLDGKLQPFEMVEKFLQRSMFVNNVETRTNWFKKIQFLMAYCVEGAITPRMNFVHLLENLFDDEDYFSRIISFLLCFREKPAEPVGHKSKDKNKASNLTGGNTQAMLNFGGTKKNDLQIAKHFSNFQFDLQNFSEQPTLYEFNEEIMHIVISNQSVLDILFLTNQPLAITKIYNFFLQTDCKFYKLQFACVQSIYQYCVEKKPIEIRLQVFKGFIYALLKICDKADRKLMKVCYLAINQIILSDEKLTLLPQFELLKFDGPQILINGLEIIDLEQIGIILNFIKILINSLDIFINLGLTQRIVQIIYILEEIEGLKVNDGILIQLESLLLLIVRKNEIASLKTKQKKTIFNLMKSTNSNSPEHMLKVMELVQEITKKDLMCKKQLGVFIVNKILNLIYVIDKNSSYAKVFQICLEVLTNYTQDNLMIRHKLQKESTLKGLLFAKLKHISQQEIEGNSSYEKLNNNIVGLCEELYGINMSNNDSSDKISPMMPSKTKESISIMKINLNNTFLIRVEKSK